MHISQISVNRPITVTMFFIAVLMIGLISLSRLSVDLLPDLSYPQLTVQTQYLDVAPEEIENLITKHIESSVSTLSGIKRISSVSKEGFSLVTIEFLWGTNMDIATLNVREKLDQVRNTLPDAAQRPVIIRIDPSSQPVMSVSVSGENLVHVKELAQAVVKRRLEQIKGVALASVTGGLDREIQVDINADLLNTYGITMSEVVNGLSRANTAMPGGSIKKGRYRYSLRTLGEFETIDQLGDVAVGRKTNGAIVFLKDIADIKDSFKTRDNITRFNGKESIGVVIQKEAGSNTVQVSEEVRKVIGQLQKEYPEITLSVAYDQAQFISDAISNVLQTIVYGGILAFLVLFLFLHDFRNPVNIALSIPISIIATFALLYFTNISLNMISLSGLALGVGMLVDNSIVVLENIYRHRQEGKNRIEAAIEGAKEISMPVTTSTLTTISVFLPIVFVRGVAGQLFKDQSLTVTFSLLTSLIVALTLLPMMASRFLYVGSEEIVIPENFGFTDSDPAFRQKGRRSKIVKIVLFPFRIVVFGIKKLLTVFFVVLRDLLKYWFSAFFAFLKKVFNPLFIFFDKYFDVFSEIYEKLLLKSLRNRFRVLMIVTGFLLIAILIGFQLDRRMMPNVDQRQFSIDMRLPVGSTLDATDEVAHMLTNWLTGFPDVESVFSNVGIVRDPLFGITRESGLNRGVIQVKLSDKKHMSTGEVIRKMREKCSAFTSDVEFSFGSGETTLQQVLGTAESDIIVTVRGEDLGISQRLASTLMDKMKNIEGLRDIYSGYEEGKPEISIEVDRAKANSYGVYIEDVARFIESYMKGSVATEFKVFDRKIDILVRPQEGQRKQIDDLLNSMFTGANVTIPLRELINYRYSRGPNEITREDQIREISIHANVENRSFKDVISDIEAEINTIEKPYDYQINVAGANEEMNRSFRSIFLAVILSVSLVFMILASQFESFINPFIIILTVPLALIGVTITLFITGISINVMSAIGMVILIGIVVNDAIIKVEFIHRLRKEGDPLIESIVEAGKKRLRPIIMTTVTTVLGLFPMALAIGKGSELRSPLAVTVIGGMISATFLTLIVIPVMYSYFDEWKTRKNNKKAEAKA